MAAETSVEERLLDTMPTGVTIHVEGKVVYANPALRKMLGIPTAEAALGRPILDFIAPEYHESTLRRVGEVYGKRAPGDWTEIEFVGADGARIPVEVVASMVDWRGKPASQVVVVDVSRRKEAERARRESEDRYRRLIEDLPLGVVVHSEGRVRYANREAGRIVGATLLSAHMGSDVLSWIHADQIEEVRERIRQMYEREGHQPLHPLRLLRRDGETVDVEVAATMVDWMGRPASQVLLIDVTARRREDAARQEIDERYRRAQKDESMEVLAGGVAHDFNNLLAGILGNADLALLDLAPGAPVRRQLENIRTAARRGADLARQMVAYAGRGRVSVETIDLGTLLRETASLLDASVFQRVRLRYELGEDVPPVEGDPTQLRQVVMNLIVNASDALDDGVGTITVATGAIDAAGETLQSPYLNDDLPPGRYVFLDVQDSGVGMDEAVLKRIFEPFFTTKFKGRGLGLAAALGIIRAHRGTVQVRSRPQHGTRVRVLLPAAEPVGRPVAAGSGAAASRARDRQATVLVVDDDETVRSVACHILRRAGFDVVEAADGETAIETFRAQRATIDCVVLDLAMPGMDGHETLRRLTALRPDIRVVVASGLGEQEAAWSTDHDGTIVFLPKPFDLQALVAAVERVLD